MGATAPQRLTGDMPLTAAERGSGRHVRRLKLLGGLLLATVAQSAVAAPSGPPQITEARNAAVGFAMTAWWANTHAIDDRCAALTGEAGRQSSSAMAAWRLKNQRYVDAAFAYLATIEAMLEVSQGQAARKAFRRDRQADFARAASSTESVWFPEEKVDPSSCLNLAGHLADGSLDFDQNAEFFPLLVQIKADMEQIMHEQRK